MKKDTGLIICVFFLYYCPVKNRFLYRRPTGLKQIMILTDYHTIAAMQFIKKSR